MIQLLPLRERFLAAEELYGMIMLDSLILYRCPRGRNIQVQALTSEPVGAVLIQCVRIFFPDSMEQG